MVLGAVQGYHVAAGRSTAHSSVRTKIGPIFFSRSPYGSMLSSRMLFFVHGHAVLPRPSDLDLFVVLALAI